MKTKLLKKLRTEAYHAYGIKGKLNLIDGGNIVVVGLRQFSTKDDIATFDISNAKKVLQKMRNEYCVSRINELRTRTPRWSNL